MNESIGIVWFDGEDFSNCQNLSRSGEWGVGSCKWEELTSLESQCLYGVEEVKWWSHHVQFSSVVSLQVWLTSELLLAHCCQ